MVRDFTQELSHEHVFSTLQLPPEEHLPTGNDDIWTIWYAAQHGKIERLQVLMDRKKKEQNENVNRGNTYLEYLNRQDPKLRWTSLQFATRFGHVEIVELLLKEGADPNIQDMNGNTALHICAQWGTLRSCVELIEYSADNTIRNKLGQLPADVAKQIDRPDVADFLSRWISLTAKRKETEEMLKNYHTEATHDILHEPEPIFLQLHLIMLKKEMLGEDHPGIIMNILKLADLYREFGRANDAENAFLQSIERCGKIFGENSTDVGSLRNNLGEFYVVHGRVDDAIPCFKQAIENLTSVYGSHHEDVLGCVQNLAICYHSARRYEESDELLLMLEKERVALYGENHPSLFPILDTIAMNRLEKKMLKEAYEIYKRCLSIAQYLHGNRELITAKYYEAVARIDFIYTNYQISIDHFQRALKIMLEKTDPDHPDVARIQNNIAVVTLLHEYGNDSFKQQILAQCEQVASD